MQERPSKLVLLTAIARFLNEEARPALSDPRLAFRALIAANLASIVAAELTTDDDQTEAELTRLLAIFGEPETAIPPRPHDRLTELHALNTRLAKLLRGETASAETFDAIEAHIMQTLRDKLSADNPRFDTSLDIE
jgi:hypothetical protein